MRIKEIAGIMVVFCFSLPAYAGAEEHWQTYTNRNDVFGIGVEGRSVWSGTTSGLYRWSQSQTGGDPLFEEYSEHIPADMYVNSILVDGDIRWFGVEGWGLVKYDGTTWTRWNADDTDLPNNWIWDLDLDSNGILWIAHSSGVSKFDGVNWTNYDTDDGMADSYCNHIEVDNANVIWAGSWSGASSYNQGTGIWTNYTTENSSLPASDVSGIAVDNGNTKWFTTSMGLASYDGIEWKSYTTVDGLPTQHLGKIAVDADNYKWIGTWGDGLIRFDSVATMTLVIADGLLSNSVVDVKVGDDGTIWAGTQLGICGYKTDGSWIYYRSVDGPISNYVSGVAIAPNGDVWFGTQSGISVYDGSSWYHYTMDDGLPDNYISEIDFAPNGNAWISTNNGAAFFNGVGWTSYKTDNSALPSDYVSSVEVESSGDVWFGTGQGAALFDGTTWTVYTQSDGLIETSVEDISVNGTDVWFAGYYGVTRFRRASNSWETYTTDNGLSSNYAMCVKTNPMDGNAWFGTSGTGVDRYNGLAWTNYKTDDGLGDSAVPEIAFGAENTVWFGSWHFGATKYDGSIWTVYTPDNSGIVSPSVNAIGVHPDGDVWFATNMGISRLTTAADSAAPPANVVLSDVGNDHGHALQISWTLSPDDALLSGYNIYRSRIAEIGDVVSQSSLATLDEIIAAEASGTLLVATVARGVDSYLDNSVALNDGLYYFWVASVSSGGSVGKAVPAVNNAVSVASIQPFTFKLEGNYPNPFNASTTISFTLESDARTVVNIFNLTGQLVRSISVESPGAGNHSVVWDGMTDDGLTVSSGVYLAMLLSGSNMATQRMLFIK